MIDLLKVTKYRHFKHPNVTPPFSLYVNMTNEQYSNKEFSSNRTSVYVKQFFLTNLTNQVCCTSLDDGFCEENGRQGICRLQ